MCLLHQSAEHPPSATLNLTRLNQTHSDSTDTRTRKHTLRYRCLMTPREFSNTTRATTSEVLSLAAVQTPRARVQPESKSCCEHHQNAEKASSRRLEMSGRRATEEDAKKAAGWKARPSILAQASKQALYLSADLSRCLPISSLLMPITRLDCLLSSLSSLSGASSFRAVQAFQRSQTARNTPNTHASGAASRATRNPALDRRGPSTQSDLQIDTANRVSNLGASAPPASSATALKKSSARVDPAGIQVSTRYR